MKIRFAEHLNMQRLGVQYTQKQLDEFDRVVEYNVAEGTTLANFLEGIGVFLQHLVTIRSGEDDFRDTTFEFIDVVYVNYELKSDNKTNVEEVELRSQDFVLVVRCLSYQNHTKYDCISRNPVLLPTRFDQLGSRLQLINSFEEQMGQCLK